MGMWNGIDTLVCFASEDLRAAGVAVGQAAYIIPPIRLGPLLWSAEQDPEQLST